MKALQWEPKQVRLSAGIELPYYAVGRGLPVLLVNGLGGAREVWDELVAHAQDRYRFVAWDYRGLLASGDSELSARGVPAHAQDAAAILAAEGIVRCAVVGWSMGVAVGLELFSQWPDLCCSLVLVSGGARVTWAPGGARSLLAKAFLRALHVARRNPRTSHALLRMGLQSPEAFTWAHRLGLVGDQFSSDLFAKIANALLEFDVTSYVGTLDQLAQYDASSVLPQVDVPVLVVGGDRDPFTPRAALEELVQGVAGAEYLLLPEGTHYALLDQSERVNLRIEKFWNERGYAST